MRGLGDCYGYYLVARGLADVMIEPAALKCYDVCAPDLGRRWRDLHDARRRFRFEFGTGLATNQALREQVCASSTAIEPPDFVHLIRRQQ